MTLGRILQSIFVSLLLLVMFTPAHSDAIGEQRQNELEYFLHQDCGSCHGMRLSGGLGPPLTRENLAEKSREYLVAVISDGSPNTPMPPWKLLFTRGEIEWLVDYLLDSRPTE